MNKKINYGYIFQDNIKKSCMKQDVLFYRFKDSATSFSGGSARFTPKNICDCMVFHRGILLFLELKSCKGKSFSFTEHSLKQLKDIDKILKDKVDNYRPKVYGGFLIEFREISKTIFISTENIIRYLHENNTKTLNYDKLIKDNNINFNIIEQTLKIKNYEYNIINLLNIFI